MKRLSVVAAFAVIILAALAALASVPSNEAYRLVAWDSFLFEGALSDPIAPIPSAGASTGGSASSAFAYQFYQSCKNLTGETALSPASERFRPTSGSSNKVSLKISPCPVAASATRLWFSRSDDEYLTIYGCGTSGASPDLAISTAVSDCLCSVSTDVQEPTSNTTSNVYNFYPVTSASAVYLDRPSVNEREICAIGCRYQTLKEACAAETSTQANPLTFHIHAGTYSSAIEQTCSGQTNVTIKGDGPGTTRIINTTTGAGDYGTIAMGTSRDWTIEDLYVKGHRAIIALMASTGGGKVTIRNNIIETTGANPDEDCAFMQDWSGSTDEWYIHGNVCTLTSDGFTNISGAPKIYAANNTFWRLTSNTINQTGGGYALQAIPTLFVDHGSVFNLQPAAPSTQTAINYAYWFNGAPGGNGTECSSGCKAYIYSPQVYIANQDSNGDGVSEEGIDVNSTGAHLVELNIHDADVNVSTTDNTGTTYGLHVQNATTVARVFGGRWRTSGGANNFDFVGTGSPPTNPIEISGADYNVGSTDDSVAPDTKRSWVSEWGAFGPVNTVYADTRGIINVRTTDDGTSGLYLDNTGTNLTRASPDVTWCNSPASGADQCYEAYTQANSDFVIRNATANTTLHQIVTAVPPYEYANISGLLISYTGVGGALVLGGGVSTDTGDFIQFDSTNDATLTWVNSIKTPTWSGINGFSLGAGADLVVGTCTIGTMALDTGGATKEWCICGTANVWGCWKLTDGSFNANGPAD